jgi:tetratricopeptide (TPR) repeat protein
MNQAVKLQSPDKVLQSYGNLIDVLYDNKKYADSVRICREILEIKTGDGKPRAYMFIVEDRFGDFGFEPDLDFDIAKRLRPAIHQLMIQALAKDGKYDQALKLADNLIDASEKVPGRSNWKERELRGRILSEMGKFPDSIKVYIDVLDRIANDDNLTDKGKEVYGERYKHILSNVYIENKEIEKAVAILRELLKNHPDEPGYYNDLGYVMADNDMNLKECEELLRKALELDREARKKRPGYKAAEDKDKGAYLDSMGWVLFKLKRYDDAKKYLLEALKDKDSQHIEIYDHLAETYLALGQKQLALDAWRRGLEVAGDDRAEKQRKAEVEKKIEKNK